MVLQEKIVYNSYKILQWNCRGVKANKNELVQLITDLKLWNLNKANWEKFQKLCSEELKEGPNIKNLIQFKETLVSITQRCIPKNKVKTKQNRPWFKDKCKEAIRLRRKALREFEKELTIKKLTKI